MAVVVIWQVDLSVQVKKIYTSTTLPNIKGYKATLQLLDKMMDALEADGSRRVAALMVSDAQAACEESCEYIAETLKILDEECKGKNHKIRTKRVDEAQKLITKEIAKLGKILDEVPQQRLEKWIKTKKGQENSLENWGKWAYETVGLIGTGVLGRMTLKDMLVDGVTGGTLKAITEVAKLCGGMYTLCKTISQLWDTAELAQARVEKSIRDLEKLYPTAVAKSIKEDIVATGVAALSAYLGVAIRPSIDTIQKEVESWSKKLDALEVKADKLFKEIETVMKAHKAAGVQLAADLKGKTSAKIKRAFYLHDLAGREIDKLFFDVEKLGARVNSGRKAEEIISGKIIPQLDARSPNFAKLAEKWIPKLLTISAFAEPPEKAKDYLDLALNAKQFYEDFYETAEEVAEVLHGGD